MRGLGLLLWSSSGASWTRCRGARARLGRRWGVRMVAAWPWMRAGWSLGRGGQWRSGGVRRPRAAVAHGPGRERPLCRGGGVLRWSGRVQGCQGSSGEVGCGVEARGRLGGLLHSGAQGGMATGASAPWPWRRRGKILPQWLALRGSNGCRGVREGVRR